MTISRSIVTEFSLKISRSVVTKVSLKISRSVVTQCSQRIPCVNDDCVFAIDFMRQP